MVGWEDRGRTDRWSLPKLLMLDLLLKEWVRTLQKQKRQLKQTKHYQPLKTMWKSVTDLQYMGPGVLKLQKQPFTGHGVYGRSVAGLSTQLFLMTVRHLQDSHIGKSTRSFIEFCKDH